MARPEKRIKKFSFSLHAGRRTDTTQGDEKMSATGKKNSTRGKSVVEAHALFDTFPLVHAACGAAPLSLRGTTWCRCPATAALLPRTHG